MAQHVQVPERAGLRADEILENSASRGCRRCKRPIPVISQAKGQNVCAAIPGAGPSGRCSLSGADREKGEPLCGFSVFYSLVCRN